MEMDAIFMEFLFLLVLLVVLEDLKLVVTVLAILNVDAAQNDAVLFVLQRVHMGLKGLYIHSIFIN